MTDAGRPYKGIAWYRGKVELASQPGSKMSLLLPAIRGSCVWVWCNGRYAGYAESRHGTEVVIDISDLLRMGQNLLVLRIEGDGGLLMTPFVPAPVS